MKKLLFLLVILLFSTTSQSQNEAQLFIGTYTNNCESNGIYSCFFDTETGDFRFWQSSDSTPVSNPSYLTFGGNSHFLFSVNENGEKSTISALRLDETGRPVVANTVNAKGADPCYIISDNEYVITANYSGGSIGVFPINADGTLSEARQVIQHQGKSITERQEKPHVHMVRFSPDKRYILAVDLGTDAVYTYAYNPKSKKEILKLTCKTSVKPGSGPRHLTFSTDGKFVYVLHELDGTLTSFSYADGKLTKLSETSVLQPNFKGSTSAADIHISDDGKFIYATNRGDANTISVFAVDKGKMNLVETIPSGGKGPRNFAIAPGGKFVLVAHQYTNEVVIFKRDAASGKLTETGKRMEFCAPVCLVFRRN